MTTPTFPDIAPSFSSSPTTQLKILEADFGDGYAQRAADGTNSVQDTWNLQWNNYSNADISSIITFLKARKGYELFNWTPPNETTSRKWICKTFTGGTPSGYNISSASATFTEVFDL